MLEQQEQRAILLNQLRSVLPSYASCIYIRQPAPLGLGHAVLCAQPAVGAEPFFVHLADDLIRSEVACLAQMARVYEAKRASVLGVQIVPRHDTDKYGIVEVEADRSATSRVRSIVEKPKPAAAPSNLAVVGRYVLSPAIFEHLERLGQGTGGEIQLTDGIASLMREEAVYAYRFAGKRYDCGSKLGYLQATVEYALAHPVLGREFRRYLRALDVSAAAGGARARAAEERSTADRAAGDRATNGSGSAEHGAIRPARQQPRRRAPQASSGVGTRSTPVALRQRLARTVRREHGMTNGLLCVACTLLAAVSAAHAQVVLVPPGPQIGSSNPSTAGPPVYRRPRTWHPCVVQLLQNLAFADFTPKVFDYAPPTACPGPWAKVVFSADFTVTAGRQSGPIARPRSTSRHAGIYYGTTAEPRAAWSPSCARRA